MSEPNPRPSEPAPKTPSRIGQCDHCFHSGRLRSGLCADCQTPESRRRKAAVLCVMFKTRPDIGRAVYDRLRNIGQQRAFVQAFGLPPGATPPGLRLVDVHPCQDANSGGGQ